jgi:protein SCO1/2
MRRNRDTGRRAFLGGGLLLALALFWPRAGSAHKPGQDERLPRIGAAPDFALTAQDGRRLALRDLRGKVVAVTFIYASCADTCPLLTTKLVGVQRRLAADGPGRTVFVAITVDPERDTTEVLAQYARAHGADAPGWAFLTGTPTEIQEVSRRYGVYLRKQSRGDVDHTFLTSLVDQSGTLRVQYLGVRFDPDEMVRDLRSLLAERRP